MQDLGFQKIFTIHLELHTWNHITDEHLNSNNPQENVKSIVIKQCSVHIIW